MNDRGEEKYHCINTEMIFFMVKGEVISYDRWIRSEISLL